MIMRNFEVITIRGSLCKPFEYLCGECGQLRLAVVDTTTCRHCGSSNITKGKPGSLERTEDNGLEGQNEGMGRG